MLAGAWVLVGVVGSNFGLKIGWTRHVEITMSKDVAGINALLDFWKKLTVHTTELKKAAGEGFYLGMADSLLGIARLVRKNTEVVEEVPEVAADLRRRLRLCAKIYARHGAVVKERACLRLGRWLDGRVKTRDFVKEK